MENERESSSSGELLDSFLDRLDGVRGPSGGQYMARCPAHEDRKPSLTIRDDDEKVLFHCFGGCSPGSVLAALGLTWKDVSSGKKSDRKTTFDRRGAELESIMCARRLQAEPDLLAKLRQERGWAGKALANLGVGYDGQRLTLPVRDKDGRLHDVLRYWPWAQKKMIAGEGRTRQPWPCPEDIDRAHFALWIVEGEGTAISLASLGCKVVALPGAISRGTGQTHRPGKFEGVGWHQSWARRLSRFPFVVCVPDGDDVGRLLMLTVQYDLQKLGGSNVVVADLGYDDGYDVGDWLRTSRTGEERRQAKALLHMLVRTTQEDPLQVYEAQQMLRAYEEYRRDPVTIRQETKTARLDWAL